MFYWQVEGSIQEGLLGIVGIWLRRGSLALPPLTKSFLNSNQVRNMVDKELAL